MKNKLKLLLLMGLSMVFLAACGGNTPEPAPAPAPQNEEAASEANADVIGEEQAKEIALNHAQVNADEAQFEKVELDTDDGRQEYEIDFRVNNIEYDYEIDAVTGDILASEQETK